MLMCAPIGLRTCLRSSDLSQGSGSYICSCHHSAAFSGSFRPRMCMCGRGRDEVSASTAGGGGRSLRTTFTPYIYVCGAAPVRNMLPASHHYIAVFGSLTP